MTEIRGAHAIVTGGSQGLGLAVAARLAAGGARVSLIARREAELAVAVGVVEAAGAGAGATARSYTADVCDPDALARAIAAVEADDGPCDILVCCAGIALPGRFVDVPLAELRAQLKVNYLGAVTAARAIVPGMVARGKGHVVFTSSTAGLIGVVGYTGYAPTKWALRGLAETLRYETEPAGVRVSVAYPPDMDTPGFALENLRKPAETVAVSGGIAPRSADEVARKVVRGIARNRAHITADALSRVLVRWGGVLDPVLRPVMTRTIRRARGATSAAPTTDEPETKADGPAATTSAPPSA